LSYLLLNNSTNYFKGENMKKLVLSSSALVAAASSAMAEVTFDPATKALSGSIDLEMYYSAIPIVLSVIGAAIAVGLMIKMVKRAA
jgi:hypothetical protein